jgi:L-alanine-DL-glutamate epimerase-like enolase superfamily enzyme
MKITDVQACVIGRQEPHSGGSVWTFVRIYTDEGITGTGECNSGGPGFSGFANKEAILAVKHMLIGEDPFNINMLYEKIRRIGRYGGSTNPPLIFALTGIENALYDIVGKALGVPIYKLLGGKFRDIIPLYADCHAGETDDAKAYGEKALEAIGKGFGAVKFDVDNSGTGKLDRYNWTVGAKEMTHVIDLIEGVRDAIGWEIDLAIDCHGQFDLPSAITLARAVEPLRLMWLEEPVPAENMDAMAQVRRSSSTVICEGKRIADIADAHYIPIAPHNVSSPLGMMAACHVMAAVPNCLFLEFHAMGISWWSDMCDGDKPFVVNGTMAVSERPGIGVELNADACKTLMYKGDTFFD